MDFPFDKIKSNIINVANEILEIQLKNYPNIKGKPDNQYSTEALKGIEFNLYYLLVALEFDEPLIYQKVIDWSRSFLAAYYIPEETLRVQLNAIIQYFEKHYPSLSEEIVTIFITPAIRSLNTQYSQEAPFIDGSTKTGEFAKKYYDFVINNHFMGAYQFILSLFIENKLSLKDILLKVIQPTQYEIGRLWEHNKINVAHEHLSTSISQRIIGLLYPKVFDYYAERQNGKKMISFAVSNELHELGIRMLTDVFQLSGWDTTYLGANMPEQGLVEYIQKNKPDLIAASVSYAYNLPFLKKVIHQVNQLEEQHFKIMVGGYIFNQIPDLWKKFDVDGYAADAEQAITIAENLT